MLRKLALALLFATFSVATALAADVTGKWNVDVQGPNGKATLTFDLQAEGNTLTGKIIGPRGTSDIQDGKVEGDTISFNQLVTVEGGTMKANYTGTVSGDSIKFTRTLGDRPPVEFTATRAK